jgi:site-specific DNA-methyltransferase (adenine-specific)
MLDEQSGERPSGGVDKRKRTHKKYESTFAKRTYDNPIDYAREPSTGGASRFFYCAKASRRERNAGLEGVNHHPTVKPLTLMEYLVKLITPLGGLVLDPFLGSGTTALACKRLGRHYIGIEISREYCDIAERRLAAVLL